MWDCLISLRTLGERNKIRLMCMPGDDEILGNEMADSLAKTGSETKFIGPKPYFGLSYKSVRY